MTIAAPDVSGDSPKRRIPRYRRLEAYPKIRIGRPKHAILTVIGVFHYLSAQQITNLLFSPKVVKYVREHLKDLYQAGYLQRIYLPHLAPHGSPLAIYCLDKKGLAYLRQHELAPEGRLKLREDAEREWLFLKHTLAANDLLIKSTQLARTAPSTRLVGMRTERELKRRPGYTRVNGRRVAVIPDGWVHLEKWWPGRQRSNQYYIAWELDRGTIEQRAFRRKIRALVAWMEDGYIEQFGVEGLTVAFVTTHSAHRLQQLVTWTEQELAHCDAKDYGELFVFSHFDPGMADPREVFLAPSFLQPFVRTPVALLVPPS